MAGVTNNLYPPIVSSYTPAFVINSIDKNATVCRVYFSLSSYNTIDEINRDLAQVIILNQNSNVSAFKTSSDFYPTYIKLCHIGIDEMRSSDDKYYIEIYSSDLAEGFKINQYYKVQIRFTSNLANVPDNTSQIASWLAANSTYFSEWSTVNLVRAISQPSLQLVDFDASSNTNTILSHSTLTLAGSLTFEDAAETDTLRSYEARLYDANTKELLISSGTRYCETYSKINEINYLFPWTLVDSFNYNLEVDVETRNRYFEKFTYKFTVIQNPLDKLDATISAETHEPVGSIKVSLKPTTAEKYYGYVTFRRTSSRSNFTIWEDIHTIKLDNTLLNYDWYDYTIESGVWYKYCAQRSTASGDRGIIIATEEPIMLIFEDMFLCADKKQLRIKYNPTISSYKKNVSESKTDTIGSQYPFIKRNAAMYYRQFSISGMITIHTDYHEVFVTKDELYYSSEMRQLYDEYNVKKNVTKYNDYIYEREFREKVIDFLYADNVKLLRTTTEGNTLVKLMDINLTPEAALGRMIYSFSATAYEVDDCTIDNLNKYNINGGILAVEKDRDLIVNKFVKVGQLNQVFAAKKNIMDILTDKYSYLNKEGFKATADHLVDMRLEFISAPYLVHEDAKGNLVPLGSKELPDATTALGYIVYINDVAIYVNPEGIYQLVNGSEITSMYFPVQTEAIIDYVAIVYQTETIEYKTDLYFSYNKVGQIWGTFGYEESIFKKIWQKYFGEYINFYKKLISINGIRIETNPNVVFWVKDSSGRGLRRFVMPNTSSLSFYDDDIVIEGLYFSGKHFEPANELDLQKDIVPENKFVDTGIVVNSIDEIKQPIFNGVYTVNAAAAKLVLPQQQNEEAKNILEVADNNYANTINTLAASSNKYIFHEGRWYLFTKDNDILCDVDGLVDYYCEVMKGVHVS